MKSAWLLAPVAIFAVGYGIAQTFGSNAVERDRRFDLAAIDAQTKEFDARDAEWRRQHPDRTFDYPVERTFIAKVPGGIASIGPDWVMRVDGTVLHPGDLIAQRVRPTEPSAARVEARNVPVASSAVTYTVDREGRVWGSGRSACVALSDEPALIPGLPPIDRVAAVTTHAIALAKDGTVWGWGCNGAQQIGLPDALPTGRTPFVAPFKLRGLDRVKQVFTTTAYSLVVRDDDTVWTLGSTCPLCFFGTIATKYDHVFKVKVSPQGMRSVRFSIYSHGSLTQGEVGYFIVDDTTGRVDGVAPWDAGYLAAALTPKRSKRIFDLAVKSPETAEEMLAPKTLVGFYMRLDGQVFTSMPWPNPGGKDRLEVAFGLGMPPPLTLRWQGPTLSVTGIDHLSYGELPNRDMAGPQEGTRFWVR